VINPHDAPRSIINAVTLHHSLLGSRFRDHIRSDLDNRASNPSAEPDRLPRLTLAVYSDKMAGLEKALFNLKVHHIDHP